jgi:ABC-2 type transport system permease protein
MKDALLIARRDFLAYFNTAWGYVILAAALLIDGLAFNAFAMGSAARYSSDVLEDFFYYSSGIMMFAAVPLTMRLFAEERSQGTMVLLDTAPVKDSSVVFGKYLAGFAMVALMTLLSAYMPALIFVNGKVSIGHILSGYLGLLCLGSAAVAIGTWGSSLTRNQFVAGIISAVTIGLLYLAWALAKISNPPFKDILSYMAFFDRHFQPFMRGRINTESLIYFGSVTLAFLMLTVRGLSGRRWQ